MENLTPAELTDRGICPTCYDRKNNNCLYGNNKDKMLFENDYLNGWLIGCNSYSCAAIKFFMEKLIN